MKEALKAMNGQVSQQASHQNGKDRSRDLEVVYFEFG